MRIPTVSMPVLLLRQPSQQLRCCRLSTAVSVGPAHYRYRASALPATNQIVASWMKVNVQAAAMAQQPAQKLTCESICPLK